MFNRKIAVFLCGLGIIGLFVEGGTTAQVASFFSIITSSLFWMGLQEKKLENR